MSREDVEQRVVEILRRRALLGSKRGVSAKQALGDLGLDSLGLVGFVSALEGEFAIAFPDDLWTAREQLTLDHFIDFVHSAAIAAKTHASSPRAGRREWTGSASSAGAEVAGRRSLGRRLIPALARKARRVARLVYERDHFIILCRDLNAEPPQLPASTLELTFREASSRDLPRLDELWPAGDGSRLARLSRQRFVSGVICLTAWNHDQVVGVDWVSPHGDDESATGLRLRMSAGTCYGMDLREHERYRGRRVGLALLGFSLEESKRRGFTRQVTYVSADNVPMLSAAVQLLGFRKVGQIRTLRLLRRPRSRWTYGGRSGRDRTLVL